MPVGKENQKRVQNKIRDKMEKKLGVKEGNKNVLIIMQHKKSKG